MKKQNVSLSYLLCISALVALPLVAMGAKETPSGSSSGTQSVSTPQGSQTSVDKVQQEEVQNVNQNAGETTKNQEKETEQVNNSTGVQNGQEGQGQSVSGEENKNQNKEQVQTETRSGQSEDFDQSAEGKNQRSLSRRSQVANAVQEMERIASQNPEIGEQIRTVAQNQNSNQDSIEDSVQKVQNRNKIVKFLIGPDYGKINEIESKLQEQQQRIQEMNQLANQLVNEGDSEALKQQIAVMEGVAEEISKELQNEQSGVSILGWLFKWFAK